MTNKLSLTAVLAASFLALAACSSPSTITLKDGTEMQTKNTPRYDKKTGFYEFKQLDDKPNQVNKDDVHSIKKL